jgi:hypothetical protein
MKASRALTRELYKFSLKFLNSLQVWSYGQRVTLVNLSI